MTEPVSTPVPAAGAAPRYDLFTLGETMLRLAPRGFGRLEEAAELEVRTGGSESNVAVALARLGLRVAWASRLPRNPLGELVARRLRGFGVDLSHVRWVDGERLGLYFIETGAAPRASQVLYDRAGSAAAGMRPEDFDWSVLDRSRHLHLTGITPALSPSAWQTVATARAEAQRRGASVSFDVNYRSRLWASDAPGAAARAALAPLLHGVDLLVCTREDARLVFDLDGPPEAVARALAARTEARVVALTLGAEGACLFEGAECDRVEPFTVHTVDRVGAGDAFDAGLLWGFLNGDLRLGLRYGMAMAALKHTLPGDELVVSREEIEALLARGACDIHR